MTEQEQPQQTEQQANGQRQVDEAQREVVASLLKEMGKILFINMAQPKARAMVTLKVEVADGKVTMSNVLVENRLYTGEG